MVLTPLPDSRTEPDGSAVIRVLSYNIRSMRDDREALARVIRACAPDLVFIQEAPRFFRWRKRAAWLAAHDRPGAALRRRHRGRAPAALFAARHRGTNGGRAAAAHPWTAPQGVRHGGGTDRGRPDRSAELPSEPAARRTPGPGGSAARPAGRHAGRRTPSRPATSTTARTGRPSGCWPGGSRTAGRSRPWGAEHTFPAHDPRQRIDAIFATAGIEVLGCGVPSGLPGVTEPDLRAATDHLPVLAALRVPALASLAEPA